MTAQTNGPTFFIIGAAKAGTTSLYDLLAQHPQVHLPFDKEPAYFCDDEYYARGDDWYLSTFFKQAAARHARGEATSRYLYFASKVAPRIQRFCASDEPKFIAILREPASLVHSFYWNSVREGKENLPFPAALRAETERMAGQRAALEARGQILYAYSQVARYATQLSDFLALFPRQRFLLLLTEDLADFPALVSRLQNFLELDDFSPLIQPVRSNAAALPKSARLHGWLRERSAVKEVLKRFLPYDLRHRLKNTLIESNLRDFQPPALDPTLANDLRRQYRPETLRLQEMIGRDLSKWLPA